MYTANARVITARVMYILPCTVQFTDCATTAVTSLPDGTGVILLDELIFLFCKFAIRRCCLVYWSTYYYLNNSTPSHAVSNTSTGKELLDIN